jgi:hypothetical protein
MRRHLLLLSASLLFYTDAKAQTEQPRQWFCYCYAGHSLRPAGTENVFTRDLPLVFGLARDAEASRTQTAIPKFAQYLHTKYGWSFTPPTLDSRGPYCFVAPTGNMMEQRSDDKWKDLKAHGERVSLDTDFRFLPAPP